jgi:hypothetical protein
LGIGSFRAAARFSTWLYRIACNTFYDHARARKPGGVDVALYNNRLPTEAPGRDFGLDFARALTLLKEERVLRRLPEPLSAVGDGRLPRRAGHGRDDRLFADAGRELRITEKSIPLNVCLKN